MNAVVAFDPLSIMAGAGGMGAVAAYALAELREARRDLLSITKESATASKELAIAMNTRAETDRGLRYAIDRLRDTFASHPSRADARQVADEVERAVLVERDA